MSAHNFMAAVCLVCSVGIAAAAIIAFSLRFPHFSLCMGSLLLLAGAFLIGFYAGRNFELEEQKNEK